jgi:uridine kinase
LRARRVSQHAALAEIARVVSEHAGETVFIGVDGYGGSGKTTFAARAQQAVPDLLVVHIDDFASPTIPEWDWDRFNGQIVAPLLAGRAAYYQRWDWGTDRGAEWHAVPAGRSVLIEGVSSTRREVAAPWGLTIWVDTPREVRLDRAADRDGADLLPMWLDVWLPSEEAYVERENPLARVDLIVSGTEPVVGDG